MEDIYQFIYESDFSLVISIMIFGFGFEVGKIYAVVRAKLTLMRLIKEGKIVIGEEKKS